jgi:hypothetical protein
MNFRFLYILPLAILGIACDDSDEFASNEKTMAVGSFNAIDVDGNAVVRFDPTLRSTETIVIKGNPDHVGNLDVEVANGILMIRSSDNVQLSDSLTIIANPSSLIGIILEADQSAVVYWDGDHDHLLNSLSIKTEANSMLGLFNIRASHIDIKQEAQSKVELESWYWQEFDTLAILKTTAVLIDDDSYLVDDNYVIVFESVREVEKDGQIYLVFDGPKSQRFFIVPNVMAKLEATSELVADEMPIRNLDIKLEGESNASVWVTEKIAGKGEGKSRLVYKGTPAINYITQGEATINKY